MLHLLEEIVERETTLEQGLRCRLGLLLLEGALCLLDEREHVAHAENAAGHPVGMEDLEVVELLAGGGEGDGPTDDLLHRQRRATAGVTIELGEDDPVEGQLLVEGLGDGDGVLAGHRVDDEEGVVGIDSFGDQTDLLHQLLVDGEATGGVDDDHVSAGALGLLDRSSGNRHGVGGLAEDRDIDLAAEGPKLLDRGRALEVGTNEQWMPALALEPLGQLAGGRRLS